MKSRLAKFLYTYRLTPQTTTGVAPAEALLGRRPRSKLDILRPLTAERVETQQMKQKQKHDPHAHERLLREGDPELPPRGQLVSRYDCQEDRAGFVRGDNE